MADDATLNLAPRSAATRADQSPDPTPARRRFTRAEFDRMVEINLFANGERVELIGGEIVAMAGEGERHVNAVDRLFLSLLRILPNTLQAFQRTRLDLPDDGEVHPDILVETAGTALSQRGPASVKLLVEAADTSIKYDRETKAQRYATAGFAEYWVFEIGARRMWVHRLPTSDGEWSSIVKVEGDETVAPLFAPDAPVALPNVGPDQI